jgi:lipopolysaccharide biosynthesis regulator YciM/predicted  nucleic acid-binding Zn-ribbon protein
MSSVKEPQESRPALDPEQAKAAIDQARASLKAGDVDGTAGALRKIATRLDAPPAQLAEAAKLMAEAGSPADALSRYLEAGRGFLESGDVAHARQNFISAYEIDGKNMDALFELGRVDVAEGKKHEALDKFVEVLRKANLKHLPALFEAGCLYELDGQHNQAILAFNRVVERDKANFAAYGHLGGLYKTRNQTNDAVAHYVRGAEAAIGVSRFEDAKRLAQAALDIDGSNGAARRALGAAEASVNAASASSAASSPAASSPAPTPAAPAAPAAPAESAASYVEKHATIADVTPVAPPIAEGATPSPSLMNVNLPADVALLEQQSHAMAQLAQVQSAVAQTYRQRMALDEEIKKAQAALEALQQQQHAVDDDLSGKRDELAKVVAEREAEEATLASLGDAISKSKSELDSLAALPALIAQAREKCSSTAELVSSVGAEVDAVAGSSNDVKGKVSAADAALAELRSQLASLRQAADSIESQIAALESTARDAHEVASDANAGAERAKTSLNGLRERQGALDKAHLELSDLSNAVSAKRAEAEAALARLTALQAQRKSQFDEIVFRLTPLVGEVEAPKRESATAKSPPARSAPATAAAASGPAATVPPAAPRPTSAVPPASVESLISAGKFAEAVQRAQTDANAKPKPADYLVDVGLQVLAAGRLQDAVSLFSSARDRDQHNSRARYELGRTFAEMGKANDALAALQTVEADPEFAVLSNVAIGKCLRRQGDVEAAEARFSKALEIEGHPDGQYHEALYQLADLHESKGDPESLGLALWSWEELQTGDPNYGDVAKRVAKLKARLAENGTRTELAHNGAVKQ